METQTCLLLMEILDLMEDMQVVVEDMMEDIHTDFSVERLNKTENLFCQRAAYYE